MTKISELGEFGLIRRFVPGGVGDDCAVIPQAGTHSLIVTTDMLVEDIHFLKRAISPLDLGHKSLAVNLSDIAAMGGVPESAFLSIALPSSTDVEWVSEFFKGFRSLGDRHGVSLLGGDTTRSPDRIVINVAVMGRIESNKIKRRSDARPGDRICVTGNLGDSRGGLEAIIKNLGYEARELVQKHHRPEPHLESGAWLASNDGVGAMMDVSDGISSDLRRIMDASSCGARIHMENLPISEDLKRVCSGFGWDPIRFAADGGEDYCLLVTIRPDQFEEIVPLYRKTFGAELYSIGEITSRTGELEFFRNGTEIEWRTQGFDHFQADE